LIVAEVHSGFTNLAASKLLKGLTFNPPLAPMIRKTVATKNKDTLDKIALEEFEKEVCLLECVGYSLIRMNIKMIKRIRRYQ
jgi:hypothetical protein